MTDKTITSQNLQYIENIYIRYSKDIFLYLTQHLRLSDEDAKDITNDAFLELLKIWQDFEPKTERAAVIWLRRTAQFLTYNNNRRQSALPAISLEAISHIPANTDVLNTLAEKEAYEKILRKIKSKLSAEEYQLFEDVVLRRRDIVRLAQEKNININTLYSRWRRLQKKIQRFL